MGFPIHIDAISMGCRLCTLRGHRQNFLNYDVFLSLTVVLILAKSADPDEMQHNKCSIMLHFIWVFTACQSTHSGVSTTVNKALNTGVVPLSTINSHIE